MESWGTVNFFRAYSNSRITVELLPGNYCRITVELLHNLNYCRITVELLLTRYLPILLPYRTQITIIYLSTTLDREKFDLSLTRTFKLIIILDN